MSEHNEFDAEGPSMEFHVAENTVQLEEGMEVYMRANLAHNSKSTNIDTTASVRYFGLASDAEKIVTKTEEVLAAALAASFRVALAEATRRASTPVDAQPVAEVPAEAVSLVQPAPVESVPPASGDFTDPLF